ncbi:hypothetical protein BDA96_01G028300 [Sorghum bicolor]|jgi:hypothetical protein|uniref:Uncharacterized protein n=1 Tax=Sorghum bicolor TaxID=4558 RepID=A0A921UX06_SORBI|nr:hypothetical protein BDA96_01G028300 [Sorghum bicolor]
MAKLANLTALLLLVAMAMATISSVHGARTLERVDQVTILDPSTVAKPLKAPSSTLEVEALLPFDGLFEEAADGPIAARYLATDCTRKTPAFGP